MSIIKSIYPSPRAFCGNPIFVYMEGSNVTYQVKLGDVVLYTGHGDGAFTVNIADIVSAAMPQDAEMPEELVEGTFFRKRDDLPVTFTITAVSDNDEDDGEVQVWRGGIALSDFRTLYKNIETAFSTRFSNVMVNYLLTSRTSDWIIPIRETELEPMAFILSGNSTIGVLKIRDEIGEEIFEFEADKDVLTTLDIEALRRWNFLENGILSNVFTIGTMRRYGSVVKTFWGIRIVITPAEVSRQRCIVRFLNSFGVYERLDLAGTVSINFPNDSENDMTYRRYDESTDSFLRRRDRNPVARSYTVRTNPLPYYERNALLDMLTSDEVWLIMPDGQLLRVTPSAENLSLKYRPDQPAVHEITFTPQEDQLYSAITTDTHNDISSGIPGRPRVFNSRFTSVFD